VATSVVRPLMLDLCAGMKGASQAMIARGWTVITLDNDPTSKPDIVADLRNWSWTGNRPDLIWTSPPCTEFARESMPWCRTGRQPDMSIVLAAARIVHQTQPRYWVIENVRGAIRHFRPHLGRPRQIIGPFYLWGFFPPLTVNLDAFRKKESYSSRQRAQRARIPMAISDALAHAIESQRALLETKGVL
jgi:site-specific DNA-cytosine methylase